MPDEINEQQHSQVVKNKNSKKALLIIGLLFLVTLFFFFQLSRTSNRIEDRDDENEEITEEMKQKVESMNSEYLQQGEEYISPVGNFKMTIGLDLLTMTPVRSDSNFLLLAWSPDSRVNVEVHKFPFDQAKSSLDNWDTFFKKRVARSSSSDSSYTVVGGITDSLNTSLFRISLAGDAKSGIVKLIKKDNFLFILTAQCPKDAWRELASSLDKMFSSFEVMDAKK